MTKPTSFCRAGLILICLLAFQLFAVAQARSTPHRTQTWFALLNQTRLTPRSGIWVDLHYRMNEDLLAVTTITRLAYTYFFRNQLGFSAGYGYVRHLSQNDVIPDVPEHRPWQQVQWNKKNARYNLSQYIRAEERFREKYEGSELIGDYSFNWRFRYNIAWSIHLKGRGPGPKIPFLIVSDGLDINAGKSTKGHHFDQNRLFLGIGYPFTQKFNASLGYLYIYQQVSLSSYVNISAFRLYVTANLDLRKPGDKESR